MARQFIIGEHPDAILNIVDATNLERNLYLTMQLLELERPMVLALNFMDEVEKAGDHIDVERLSQHLGVPVIPISARTARDWTPCWKWPTARCIRGSPWSRTICTTTTPMKSTIVWAK